MILFEKTLDKFKFNAIINISSSMKLHLMYLRNKKLITVVLKNYENAGIAGTDRYTEAETLLP